MTSKIIAWLAAAAAGSLLRVATSAFGQTWTQTSAPITNWSSIACSADGRKLVAVIKGGPIYTSTDGGVTWMATSAPITNWTAVACSADGIKIVAAAAVYDGSQYASGGPIYVSGNSGASWTSTDAPSTNWAAVASSADGSQMVAVAGGRVVFVTSAPDGPIYRSMDSGATWTAAGAPSVDWTSVAASADGTTLAATVYAGSGPSLLYTSTDSGATWVSTNAGFAYLVSVASSAEGRRLVAGTFDPFHPPGTGGAFAVSTSTNGGGTWRQAPAGGLGRGLVASSADGTRLVAAGGPNGFGRGGSISRSIDSGVTWTADNSPSTNWSSVASSADGHKLAAAVNGGGIWTLQSTPAPRLSIAPADTDFVLSWTVPSLPFVLQENSDLTRTNWADAPTPPTLNLTNLMNQVAVPLPVSNRFYRLKSP